ncbi:hypothetical protein EUTSA_v10015804mg, partial [Eutrema salsugineum]
IYAIKPQTKSIAFKEPEYVHKFGCNKVVRISFVNYMHQRVSRFQGQVINSFEIHLFDSVGLGADIEYIEFAVSKQVKKLVLDFSNSVWREVIIELLVCVYTQNSLQSLCIYACRFDPFKFANPELLRSLCVGWTELDSMMIEGQIKELVVENYDFPLMSCFFDLPSVDIFKYSGHIFCLDFEKVNMVIKEAYLDFGVEGEYEDEPTESHIAQGEIPCVCVIQECHDPDFMLRDLEAQHLVLRTKLHLKEFMGIRILLENCPVLQTLTFDYVPPDSSFCSKTITYRGIDRQTYWLQNISYKCLIKTLKAVVFKKFTGSLDQLHMLNFLVRTGPECVRSLERVDK